MPNIFLSPRFLCCLNNSTSIYTKNFTVRLVAFIKNKGLMLTVSLIHTVIFFGLLIKESMSPTSSYGGECLVVMQSI